MLVGLISDTHDNGARTKRALELLAEADAQRLLHAGDLTTGQTVPLFEGWQVHLAQGNVDRVKAIEQAIETQGARIAYADKHELEIDGRRIGVIHGDDAARLEGMVNSGAFDLVVHGHTHTFRDEQVGPTRVVNPGAVHRSSAPSVCTYDTATDELTRLLL